MRWALGLCALLAALAACAPEPAGPAEPPRPRRDADADARDPDRDRALGALLARALLHGRRAPAGRMSLLKTLQSLEPGHRISDRDYTGWMDFGRRSAEDYD
ncbi:cholecystokinin [Dipodomys merriami]|uniref:cholecystokinin n=1 Tax=Dipodomys merriami TaxID=94247 RepID=UPI003850CE6E